MIGLFWVTEADVYLGLPPAAQMTGVSMSPSELRRVALMNASGPGRK
ncbi:hypothetical protein DWB77_07492 [Streptomyces hundungensis]|uniref:Uncharacterized protein n=1 Tax=Streptomyces hundungensis TaxID=1077946 RepID=A0A387HN18_9ACTN|nr:hypothetical protein DWB77_07492 [Streptomyces hundungensis]